MAGVEEGLDDRARVPQPIVIHLQRELATGAFRHDLQKPFVARLLRQQAAERGNDLLRRRLDVEEHFEALVIEAIDRILIIPMVGAALIRMLHFAGSIQNGLRPRPRRRDSSDFLGQFALLGSGSASVIGFEPWDETRVKEAALAAVGFARTADFFEKKPQVIHERDWIDAELQSANGIDVASDGEGIAPLNNLSRKSIVDAEDLLANAPVVVSAHAANDAGRNPGSQSSGHGWQPSNLHMRRTASARMATSPGAV